MKSIIFFIAAYAAIATASAQTSNTGKVLSAAGGRYVLGQISDFRADQYLLDTQTGRAWRVICTARNQVDKGECEATAFQPQTFLDATGKFSGFLAQ